MRMTLATTLVMQAIGAGHRHGFDIVEVTRYPTGTVYPALRRLERDGYVRSRWEAERAACVDSAILDDVGQGAHRAQERLFHLLWSR